MFRHRDHRSGHPEHGPGRRHGGRGGRLFDYGELRLLILALLAEQPRHGYELIKAIEERLSGSYSPSPGVIYPTLAWAEDMGYAVADPEGGGRKTYRLTPEGEAFLAANRAAADELLSRGGMGGPGGRPDLPAPVLRAMENLKLALRLRLREGALTAGQVEAIAAALDAAAQAVERSR
ncbi:PadR family transcriptional regulator [Aureimonas leprariae]|nr:PadR family transcriptional regulator [Aureimonas leprariae]